jgi:hypothetical protein
MAKRRKQSNRPVTFSNIVRHARAAIKGSGIGSSRKLSRPQIHKATMTALRAVRSFKKGKRSAFNRLKSTGRVLPLPKTGGVLPLLPIFAGLSALGSLAGGAAGVAKAINEARDARKKLSEMQRHNETMEAIALRRGKGLYFKPYKTGLGLYMTPFRKQAKNF